MRRRTIIRLVVIVLLCGVFVFGYRAMKFDRKVRAFNSQIHIGESMRTVRAMLGEPSLIVTEHDKENKDAKYEPEKPPISITWIYYGSYSLRRDLCLVFDGLSQKLVEKKRGIFLVE